MAPIQKKKCSQAVQDVRGYLKRGFEMLSPGMDCTNGNEHRPVSTYSSSSSNTAAAIVMS